MLQKIISFISLHALISTTLAVDDRKVDDRQLEKAVIPSQSQAAQSVSNEELVEYVRKGLPEEFSSGAETFREFLENLNNPILNKEGKLKLSEVIKRNESFQNLTDNYIKAVAHFFIAFNGHMESEGRLPIPEFHNTLAVPKMRFYEIYPKHEPFFIAFQKITDHFLAIREKCARMTLARSFETIESETDKTYKIGLFKDDNGYVPFPIQTKADWYPMSLFYGTPNNPQKHFTFRKGELVEESGIIASPRGNHLKFLVQRGAQASYPYTSELITRRESFDSDSPLMQALKAVAPLDDLKTEIHFITLPETREERDLLELLFLEQLLEEKKALPLTQEDHDTASPTPRFLTWIESKEGGNTVIADRIQQLEQELTKECELQAQKELTSEDKSWEKEFEMVSKNKGTDKRKKNHRGKTSQKPQQTPSSKEKYKADQTKKAREIFEQVKQKGRVRFRNILQILNTIRSETTDEVFSKFSTIGQSGSHITFHMEQGEGVTLVNKHGKQDRTYPAGTVNHFSERLIRAIFNSNPS